MNKILEKLFTAAENYSEPEHTVDALQNILRRSWEIMTINQRIMLLYCDEVTNLATQGGRGEFEPKDLENEIEHVLAGMETAVAAAGCAIKENEGGFFWETNCEASEDFPAREDAVADAHRQLLGAQQPG